MAASTKSLEGIVPQVGGIADVVLTLPLDASTGNPAPSTMTPVATAAASGSQIAKAAPGRLYGLNVVSGATAGYVLVYDAVAVPADGTTQPKKAFQLPANSSLDRIWDRGLFFAAGIVVVFSSTGPFTKTISNTAFIETETV